jgi:hypothetical protein
MMLGYYRFKINKTSRTYISYKAVLDPRVLLRLDEGVEDVTLAEVPSAQVTPVLVVVRRDLQEFTFVVPRICEHLSRKKKKKHDLVTSILVRVKKIIRNTINSTRRENNFLLYLME